MPSIHARQPRHSTQYNGVCVGVPGTHNSVSIIMPNSVGIGPVSEFRSSFLYRQSTPVSHGTAHSDDMCAGVPGTHNPVSAVIKPNSVGIVPVIALSLR